ncbi:hypothetical protein ACRAWD_13105 [Caulobacter segnis]
MAHPLTRQAWGGLDFYVRDPDGNMVSFVEYATGALVHPCADLGPQHVDGRQARVGS